MAGPRARGHTVRWSWAQVSRESGGGKQALLNFAHCILTQKQRLLRSIIQDSFKTIRVWPLPSAAASVCFRSAPANFSSCRSLERKAAYSACICQAAYRGTKFKQRRSRISVVETGTNPIKTPLGMAAACLEYPRCPHPRQVCGWWLGIWV